MLVYRVEHKIRRHGPYRTGGRSESITEGTDWLAHTKEMGRPCPENDIKCEDSGIWEGMKFGFSTVLKTKKWFGEFAKWLHENGYVVSVYSVNRKDVILGGKQCCFDNGTLKEQIAIKDFF